MFFSTKRTNFTKKIVYILVIGCFFSCKNQLATSENGWHFERHYEADSSRVSETEIIFFDTKNNKKASKSYYLGCFPAKFTSLPRYLKREDLPDSAVSVCRGQWLGSVKWLCAAQKNGTTLFYEADEDPNFYGEEDAELPLVFRERKPVIQK